MKNKDYYHMLGVSRDGSPEDIQRAFRKRARMYHPDVCKEADAEERFKEINEAYGVLSDTEKRSLYDQYGNDWEQMNNVENGQRPYPGDPNYQESDQGNPYTWSDFASFHQDSHSQGGFNYHASGGGEGAEDINDILKDIFRGRNGDNIRYNRQSGDLSGRTIQADLDLSIEDLIQKRTQTISFETSPHPVRSEKEKIRKIEVRIPAGVTNGSVIRLRGQGEPGIGKGPAGDLLLKIRVLPDNRFQVKGFDLESGVTVSPWEAALGAKIDIETSSGNVRLKIPAGTRSGRRFRLKGKGLEKKNGQGDMYVVVRIDIPEKLSEKEKELFKELAKVSAYKPGGQYRNDVDLDRAA